MKSIFVYGITGLALAIACTAQTNSQPSRSSAPTAVGDAVDDTIRGIGIPGTVPLFTAPRTLGNSVIIQDVTGGIGIGTAPAGGVKLGVGESLGIGQYLGAAVQHRLRASTFRFRVIQLVCGKRSRGRQLRRRQHLCRVQRGSSSQFRR